MTLIELKLLDGRCGAFTVVRLVIFSCGFDLGWGHEVGWYLSAFVLNCNDRFYRTWYLDAWTNRTKDRQP